MICDDEYIVGKMPRFAEEFRLGNVLTDPTTVKFIFEKPSDAGVPTVWTYGGAGSIVRTSVGKFHADIELTEDGTWKWRWESTGTVVSADQGTFYVKAENPIG